MTRSPSASWRQARSAIRVSWSAKESPVSSRQLPRPLLRGSLAPSSRIPLGPSTTSPRERGEAEPDRVGGDEVAVVVVAGDGEAVLPVVGRLVQRLQAEALPRAARGGVVARVEQERRAARVGDRAGHRVHAHVVVPVAHQQRHDLAVGGLSQLAGQVRGALGEVAVEGEAAPVGVDGALHEPAGAAGHQPRLDLEPRRLARHRDPGQGVAEALPRGPVDHQVVVVPGVHAARPSPPPRARHTSVVRRGVRPPASSRQRRRPTSSTRAGPASPRRAPLTPASSAMSSTRRAQLLDLALGLAGDEAVAPDQSAVAAQRRLADVDPGADGRAGRVAEVGHVGPEVQGGVAVEAGADHRVVAGEHHRALVVQEQPGRGREGDQQPQRHEARHPARAVARARDVRGWCSGPPSAPA